MSLIRAFFGWPRKNLSKREGLFGSQIAGPRFTDQTSLGVFDYLKETMAKHFHWSPKEAEAWLQSQASRGNLEAIVLAEKGIVLTSPDGKIEYEFTKLSERSWEVVKIKPDIPMPES